MSTTREEILAALTDHPDGLTSKELAPMCPACDCDPQVVARVVAMLRSENVIHPGTELRDGGTIWISGPAAIEEKVERITLPEQARPSTNVSEAARAIAAMRQGSAGAPRAKDQPAATKQAAPQPAAAPQEGAPMTLRARIEAALRMHGPMTARQMRERGMKDDALGQNLADLVKRKVLERRDGDGPRSSVYLLPDQKPGQSAPPSEPQRATRVPAKPKKARKAKAAPAKKAKRAKAPRAQAPAAPPAANGAPAFAINEHGELGIEHETGKVRLGAADFARLREFIERTEPVWRAE